MERYIWSRLNKQQVGAYAECFVKMELTMLCFQVYGTEVDDREVDFVALHGQGVFMEIQVKSLRSPGYVFIDKEKFRMRKYFYLVLGLLFERRPPELFLIPSTAWNKQTGLSVSRDYAGLKSKPE